MDEILIRRFFEKQCTPEEADAVISFLNRHPHLLDKYLNIEDWNSAEPVQMDDAFWQKLWTDIDRQRSTKRILLRSLSAAAAILLLVLAGTFLFSEKKSTDQTVVAEKTSFESIQRVRVNNTDKPVYIDLPDSSTVLLSPGSVITYQDPFTATKRDIQLEGKGRFKVTHNPQQPFTVYAGGLATTALGTEFTINTNSETTHIISVQLHTGKVVVKQTGHISRTWEKDVYLNPGEQLNYHLEKMIANVGPIEDDRSAGTAKTSKSKQKNNSRDKKSELEFVNAPLPQVIAQLEKQFGITIIYDSVEISGMNFTGRISRNDSPSIVLKVLAQMNDLELSQNGEQFILEKLP